MSTHDEWLADVKPTRNVGGRPRERSDSDQRNRKLECVSCGFICRASATAIRGAGAPSCGCGAGPLSVPLERDAIAVDPHGTEAQAAEVREIDAHERAALAKAKRTSRGAGAQQRCGAAGCNKFARGTFCAEHVGETYDTRSYRPGRGRRAA